MTLRTILLLAVTATALVRPGLVSAHATHGPDSKPHRPSSADRHEAEATPLETALREAGSSLRRARRDGNSLGVMRAAEALQPWLEADEPPDEVLLLRATLRQHEHDFDAALSDLALYRERRPGDPRGWLVTSTVLLATGRPVEARRVCAPLLRIASELTAATCLARAASVSGEAAAAYRLLERALGAAPASRQDAALESFARTSLGEIAARLGWQDLAREAFESALDSVPAGAPLLAAYADFLLDSDEPEAVGPLLGGRADESPGLTLRRQLAALRIRGAGAAEGATRALDTLHSGERARLLLALGTDVDLALALARRGFADHREPRDVRTLLEAALAAGRPEAAAPAVAYVTGTGLEDVEVARLLEELRADRQHRDGS